jgi:hypothetical protein
MTNDLTAPQDGTSRDGAHAAIAAPARPRASLRDDSRVNPPVASPPDRQPSLSVRSNPYSPLNTHCCENRLSPASTRP